MGKEQGQGLKPGLLPLSPMAEGELFSGGMLVSRECTLSPMPPQSPFPLVQIGIMNPAEPPPPAPAFHLSPTNLETRVGLIPLPSITEMCPCSPGAPGKPRLFWGIQGCHTWTHTRVYLLAVTALCWCPWALPQRPPSLRCGGGEDKTLTLLSCCLGSPGG